MPARARLLSATPAVLQAYACYTKPIAQLCRRLPADTTPANGVDLQGNYRYMLKSAREYRTMLLAACDNTKCALCDQGPASTLDHYLPKARYPEFAILPLNLIPCCYDCNKGKLDQILEDDRAIYLHAYLDAIPRETQFLFASIEGTWAEHRIRYWVDPPPVLDRSLRDRIRTHFARLALGEYYRREALGEVSEKRQIFEDYAAEGRTNSWMQAELGKQAASIAGARGKNNWRYAIVEAIAHSGLL